MTPNKRPQFEDASRHANPAANPAAGRKLGPEVVRQVEPDGCAAAPPSHAAPSSVPGLMLAGGRLEPVCSPKVPEVEARPATRQASRPRGKGKARGRRWAELRSRGRWATRGRAALAARCRRPGDAAAVADFVGCARSQVARWLDGSRIPSLLDAVAIERVTRIPVAWWSEAPEPREPRAAVVKPLDAHAV